MREGQFITWAMGPRSCSGKEFAQVEFVAALAILFVDGGVHVRPKPGERVWIVYGRDWRAVIEDLRGLGELPCRSDSREK